MNEYTKNSFEKEFLEFSNLCKSITEHADFNIVKSKRVGESYKTHGIINGLATFEDDEISDEFKNMLYELEEFFKNHFFEVDGAHTECFYVFKKKLSKFNGVKTLYDTCVSGRETSDAVYQHVANGRVVWTFYYE